MNGALPPVIAIDGPSASGKGTVAQGVANALGFHYLNSGALYRTAAVAAIRAGTNLEKESSVVDITLNMKTKLYGDSVQLDGQEMTDAIRTEEISEVASRIAAYPKVRSALLQRQRGFRKPPGLVADGRDMGTVVFPDAVLKIYLTASLEERAARRYKQLMGKGLGANMAALLQDIRERDQRDSARAAAPLKMGADAVQVDTTNLAAVDAIAQVLALYKQVPKVP